MTVIKLSRFKIDGIGKISFPDGKSGTVRIKLEADAGLKKREGNISGRQDLVSAAVRNRFAELHLEKGGRLCVAVSVMSFRSAAIKIIANDLTGANIAEATLPSSNGSKVAVMAPDLFSLFGIALLKVNANWSGTVDVSAEAVDGLAPGLLKLSGHPELMEAAYHSSTVQLELLGFKFRTRVRGQSKDTGNIFVVAQPLFSAMAKHLKARSRH
jgi:hypothetical protein